MVDTKNFSYSLLENNLKLVKYVNQVLRLNSRKLKVALYIAHMPSIFMVLRFSRYKKTKTKQNKKQKTIKTKNHDK